MTRSSQNSPLPESLVWQAPKLKHGFFSILQFEPSAYRQERVNVGVVLEGAGWGYQGARRRRNMERLIQIIDPNHDVKLVRALGQSLEREFKNKEFEDIKGNERFIRDENPRNLKNLISKFQSYKRFPFRLTDPRPIAFDARLSFDSQLQVLYDTLVARPKLEIQSEERLKKGFVQRDATKTLRKYIEIETHPPEVQGAHFKDHLFDAAQTFRGKRKTYFEFASFDLVQPSTSSIRLFIQSVEDITALAQSNSETPSTQSTDILDKEDFYLIYQPPTTHRSPEAEKTMALALDYLSIAKVPHIQLGDPVEQLGMSLRIPEDAAD